MLNGVLQGTKLTDENIDTDLENGHTYYSADWSNTADLSGTFPPGVKREEGAASGGSGFKIFQYKNYYSNSTYNIQLMTTSRAVWFRIKKSTSAWNDWQQVYTSTNLTSLSAASGGDDVSLVTTGEKYTWDNKSTLALGETSSTAYRGDRGKTAYTHATDSSRLTTAKTSALYKVASTAEGHIASLTDVEKADITTLGIPASDTVPSAYCTTAAATAAKTATCTDYALLSKSWIQVIIKTANTSKTALTLSINGNTAKSIYINGSASSTSNYTLPAGSYFVYYDGTNYYFRTDGILLAGQGRTNSSQYRKVLLSTQADDDYAATATTNTGVCYASDAFSYKANGGILRVPNIITSGYLSAAPPEDNAHFPASGFIAQDVRNATDFFTTTAINFIMGGWITDHGWSSGIHFKPSGGAYAAWEIMGYANNSDGRTKPLYVRGSNKNVEWGDWRKIYDSSNPPTASEVSALPISGGTMTGVIKAYASQYTDDGTTCAIDMQNSNIIGLNSIYTADASNNAAEGIHFYRDATHVDTLWMNAGDLLFAPNRELGTSTTKANSQKVGRFTANPTSGQVVVTDGTTGGIKTTGYTIETSVPDNAVFTDTWTAMVGATSSSAGTAGYIGTNPPTSGYNTKYWRADGTWSIPPDTKVSQTLVSGDADRPLLLAYSANSVTTETVTNVAYRNNSIYANPSTGIVTSNKFTVPAISGVSFINKTTNAGIHVTKTASTSQWFPAVYMDTYGGGCWQIGSNNSSDRLMFIYGTGTNRTAGTNTTQKFQLVPFADDNAHTLLMSWYSATPTSGQVLISDGTVGGLKSSGYTIAKSVPANAEFTDTWDAMVGATSSAAGTKGYIGVDPPTSGYNTKFWGADATWKTAVTSVTIKGTSPITVSSESAITTTGTRTISLDTVPIASGGTGATTALAATNNLGALNWASQGIKLTTENIDTDLTDGYTYYCSDGAATANLSGTFPKGIQRASGATTGGSGFKLVCMKSYHSSNYKIQVMITSNNNIYYRVYASSGSFGMWRIISQSTSVFYGTCSTAAATAAKTVTLSGNQMFELVTGITINVKFSNYNSATSPTLAVNDTDAKPIVKFGTTTVGTGTSTSWRSGATCTLTYDGTSWILHEYDPYCVSQSNVTSDANYQLLLASTSGTSTTAWYTATNKSAKLYFNPSSGSLSVNGYVYGAPFGITTYTLTTASPLKWNSGYALASQSGATVQIIIQLLGSGSAATGGTDAYHGTLTDGPLPARDITLIGYTGSTVIMGWLTTTGDLTARPMTNVTVGSGSGIYLTGTFIGM